MTVGVLGKTDRAGRGDPFQSRGDVDAVAHEVAVGLLDDVAKVNADPEFYAALGRQAGVALDEAILHLDGAAHGVDHAAELDEAAVAGALDDAAMVRGNGGIDQIAAQSPKARERAILVGASKPAIADNVRNQDRSNLPDFGHGAPSRVMQNSTRKGLSRASKAIGTEGSRPEATPGRLRVDLTDPPSRPGRPLFAQFYRSLDQPERRKWVDRRSSN